MRSHSRRDGRSERKSHRSESPTKSGRDTRKSHRSHRHHDEPPLREASRKSHRQSSRRTESPDTGRRSGRTSRKSGSASKRSASREVPEEKPSGASGALPPLPEAGPTVRGKSAFDVGAFAAADARAKESLEKLRKWERAFERDYGEWPTDEDKGNSNTYQSCERKYRQLVTQMEQLIEDVGGNPPGEVKVHEVSTTPGGGGGGAAVEDSGAGAIEEEVAALDVTDAAAEPAATGKKKRAAVSAESGGGSAMASEDNSNFEAAVVPKSKEATAFLNEAARKVLLFSSLGEEELQTIIGAMFELKASAGQMLINEGEQGDNFYVAQSGTYSVYLKKIPNKAIKSYGPGDSFGELALLYNTPRAASVKCTQSGTLWALDRATFRVILMSQKQSSDHTMLEFLRAIPLFSSLTTEQLVRVASVVNVLKFQGGEHVVRQGDHADSIYLIKEGTVVCMRRGEDDKYPLHQGDVFGESALNEELAEADRARKADVVADGALTVVQLMQEDFHKLLGSSLDAVARKNLNLKIMSAVKFDGTALTSMLSTADLDKLVDALQTEDYQDGETVVEEGATGDTFYIIKNGAATVSTKQRGDVATLTEGDFFGEMALLRAEPRAATIAAQGNLKCLILNRITFTRLLGPLQERLALEMDRRELQMGTIKFSDLEPIKLIGVGSFAFVRLVLHRPSNTTYASRLCTRAT